MSDWPDDVTAVRAADLAAAAGTVRQFRRRRRATAATFVTVAVAAVVSSRALMGLSTTSLQPADTPPAPPPTTYGTPSASPSTTPPVLPPATGAPRASVPPRPSATPVARAGVPGPDGGGARSPSGGDEPGGPRWLRAPVVSRVVSDETPLNCLTLMPTQPLCGTTGATVRRDGTVLLTYTACRPDPNVGAARAEFATTQEVDFAIRQGTTMLWHWGARQRFPVHEHDVTVGNDTCRVWQTVWNGRLDDGRRLAPGTYTVRGTGRDRTKLLPRRVDNTFRIKA